MTLKIIEYSKREPRKALGQPDASDRSCDKNTHLKTHLEMSKAIVGAEKLLV